MQQVRGQDQSDRAVAAGVPDDGERADRQTEARIPTADDLAAELEQFLKEQRTEGDEGAPDDPPESS